MTKNSYDNVSDLDRPDGVCILNPGDATFQETIRPLLAEAYEKTCR